MKNIQLQLNVFHISDLRITFFVMSVPKSQFILAAMRCPGYSRSTYKVTDGYRIRK